MMLSTIVQNLSNYSEKQAFYIQGQSYTYKQLSEKVSGITEVLLQKQIPVQSPIGVLATDCLETYAAILALWFSRMVFVPISPANPVERNQKMAEQAQLKYLLTFNTSDAADTIETDGLEVIETNDLNSSTPIQLSGDSQPEDILYILFTSGSTGLPKGVPITRANLNAYVNAFFNIGYDLDHRDRFLQIFDFTFDVSVQSYVLPLVLGASIYTVPREGIRFLAAIKIMKDHDVSFAKLVPSTLQFLKPYFSRIHLSAMRYSLFSGEALSEDLTKAWSKCVPNAIIENHYGPTEGTIDCLYHRWSPKQEVSYNGIVSIGKLFDDMEAIVVQNNTEVQKGEKGELWIKGPQITPGYWRNEAKNKEAFTEVNGMKYYKTGDIVFQDEEDNFLFCGRKDNQVQIQGYRVELGEVEHHVSQLLGEQVVVDTYAEKGVLSLVLFIAQRTEMSEGEVYKALQEHLPGYMIPSKIIYQDVFPRTVSGKINRKALRTLV